MTVETNEARTIRKLSTCTSVDELEACFGAIKAGRKKIDAGMTAGEIRVYHNTAKRLLVGRAA